MHNALTWAAAARARVPTPVRRVIRDGATVAGLLFFVYLFVIVAPMAGTVGFDALSYWIYSIDDPYAITHGTMGSFVYSPVAARLFQVDSLLPFWQFLWLWEGLLLGTVLWLGGRRWWLALLAFPPVALELYHGNIHLLIAAAIVLGFRYPAAWAFVLLTKVTPGVGLLWFVVRREWRNLAIAVGVTLTFVAVSIVVDAQLWTDWWQKELLVSLRQPPNQPQIAVPLFARLAVAAILVVAGARTDRKWTVPVAAAIAMPVLWIAALSVLAALPAVRRVEDRERDHVADAMVPGPHRHAVKRGIAPPTVDSAGATT